jgi:hypothetical protein
VAVRVATATGALGEVLGALVPPQALATTAPVRSTTAARVIRPDVVNCVNRSSARHTEPRPSDVVLGAMRSLAVPVFVALIIACGPSASATPSGPSAVGACAITTPPPTALQPPPTFATGINAGTVFRAGSDSFLHGNDALVTILPNDVTLRPSDPAQGVRGGTKFPWYRLAPGGELTITTRRLDAPATPIAADVPVGYGDTGFQVSGLYFPSAGCWRVTGTVGAKSLSFVVRVAER